MQKIRSQQHRFYFLFVFTILSFLIMGCSDMEHSMETAQKKSVSFFAAASTTNAVEDIVALFERETGITVQLNLTSSSALARQIESGADAGVYLSANQKWMNYLDEKHLIGARTDLLGNRLAIAVPSNTLSQIKQPADLLVTEIQHLSLAETDAVPAGIYAKQALMQLGLWNRIKPKIVQASDVRRALFFVESGEAEAGIVFTTDAAISPQVRIEIVLDKDLHESIRYPLALLKSQMNNRAARRLYDYLASRNALDIFRKYGFAVLDNIIPA